jgi:hypothetical protein
MNLVDLRDHLDQQAAQIDGSGDLPLKAVRRRATRIRRTRVAVAVAGAAAVVGAVAVAAGVVPGMVGTDRPEPIGPPIPAISTPGGQASPDGLPSRVPPDGLPSRVAPTNPHDYVRDVARFRSQVAGDTLRGAMIGRAGQSSIEITAHVDGPAMTVRFFCVAATQPDAKLEITIEGVSRVGGLNCHSDDAQAQIESQAMPFPVSSVQPSGHRGRPVQLRAHLVDDKGTQVTDPTARFGIGAYETGAYRSIGTIQVSERLEHNGYLYRLAKLEHSPVTGSAGHELTTPANTPFLVVYGSSGDNRTGIDLDGIVTPSGRDGSMIVGAALSVTGVAPRPAGRVAVFAEGPHTNGDYLIGLYLPVP